LRKLLTDAWLADVRGFPLGRAMFIRWKRRKKAATKPGHGPRRRSQSGDSLYCVLVESWRVRGGVPRQKVICYLGSVDEGDRERLCVRVNFWDRLRRCLDQLQIDAPERTKIEASIERVVSRAAEDEAAQFRVDRDKYQKFMRSIRPPVVPKLGIRRPKLGTTKGREKPPSGQ
jgi:hypothetical protein